MSPEAGLGLTMCRQDEGWRQGVPALGRLLGDAGQCGVCIPVLRCVPAGCLPVFCRLAKNQRLVASCLVRGLIVSKPGDGKAMVLWNWGSPAPPNLLGLRPPAMG